MKVKARILCRSFLLFFLFVLFRRGGELRDSIRFSEEHVSIVAEQIKTISFHYIGLTPHFPCTVLIQGLELRVMAPPPC